MTDAMAEFLNAHAECAHCHQPVTHLEAHMNCGSITVRGKRKPAAARVRVPDQYCGALLNLDMKERVNQRAFLRKWREQSASGSYTRNEIMVLRRLQEDRCFYCFASLLGPGGGINGPVEPVTCHKDHFVALCDGGSNSISNIVLACPRCNDSKGAEDGLNFMLYGVGPLNRTARAGVRRIHKARQAHKYRLILPPDLAPLGFELLQR